MAVMPRSELRARAAALGHVPVGVNETKSKRRFTAECSCGWGSAVYNNGRMQPSRTYATLRVAIESLEAHLSVSVRRHGQGGVNGLRASG